MIIKQASSYTDTKRSTENNCHDLFCMILYCKGQLSFRDDIEKKHDFKRAKTIFDVGLSNMQICFDKKKKIDVLKIDQLQYTHFFIRTSKFCRGSLLLFFWLLQPQFVLNFVLIYLSGLK